MKVVLLRSEQLCKTWELREKNFQKQLTILTFDLKNRILTKCRCLDSVTVLPNCILIPENLKAMHFWNAFCLFSCLRQFSKYSLFLEFALNLKICRSRRCTFRIVSTQKDVVNIDFASYALFSSSEYLKCSTWIWKHHGNWHLIFIFEKLVKLDKNWQTIPSLLWRPVGVGSHE